MKKLLSLIGFDTDNGAIFRFLGFLAVMQALLLVVWFLYLMGLP